MKSVSFRIDARTLQYILIGIIIASVMAIFGIFVVANSIIGAKAVEADHSRIEAELAEDEINRLKRLKIVMANDQEAIDKAAKIIASSQKHAYQDQIISDITAYANQSGVKIVGFDFNLKSTAPKSNSAIAKANNLQLTAAVVKINDDTEYASLLKLIKLIELNVTKIQLTKLSLVPSPGDPTKLLGTTIEFEVFTR